MASAARGATAPRLKQVNLSERALRLLRVDIARINVGKPHMVTISDPLRSAAAAPVLDLAKHLGAEVVGDRAADVPREAAHAQAVGGVALDSTVRSARSFASCSTCSACNSASRICSIIDSAIFSPAFTHRHFFTCP